jgi:hypothetical protein
MTTVLKCLDTPAMGSTVSEHAGPAHKKTTFFLSVSNYSNLTYKLGLTAILQEIGKVLESYLEFPIERK